MKKNAAGVILTIIFFILVYPCTALDSIDPVIIAKSDSARYNSVAFDDEKVAWIEYGLNDDDSLASSIHCFDIKTGRQETVIVDPSGKFSLDLSDSRYVWSDNRGIFLYDENENLLTFLYSTNSQYNPVIDGNIIVWEEKIKNRSFLRMYDISTGEYSDAISRMTTGNDYYFPAICGDNLVFIEKNRISSDINLVYCNLTTGELNSVARLSYIYQPPAIDCDSIVWTAKNGDDYSVFIYNITTGITSSLSPKTGYQMYPDISGGNIVWVYYGQTKYNFDEGGEIYLYDTVSKKASLISPPGEKQDFPKVSKDYVVWTDRSGSAHDIYLYGIPGKAGVIPKSTSTNPGIYSPTPNPAPDTKVRYYSSISAGETQWYSIEPLEDECSISFEVRWKNKNADIYLSVVSPDNSIWRFSDEDDLKDDSAIRMSISDINGGYSLKKDWTIAVSGDFPESESSYYDICWY
ncbi:MAG: hypothetical protein PHV39_00605 [Methanomicrobium sp.]|nr:hypothetical protein [Methanomicrobium sp.]